MLQSANRIGMEPDISIPALVRSAFSEKIQLVIEVEASLKQ
jgi:hypothetical protein